MVAEDNDIAPDLTNMDVPMSETAPEPEADFNAAPPPVPEIFDPSGKAVPYHIELMLGRNGIKKESYSDKTTGETKVYYTADVLGRVVGTADLREMNLAGFDNFVRPPGRYTSFVPRGKGLSEIAHLAKVAGLDINAYALVGEMAVDLAVELRKKGPQRVQALATISWEWWSKEQEWINKKGESKKGKVVRYGMRNADTQLDDGTYSHRIIHKETGEVLLAKATIKTLKPLL